MLTKEFVNTFRSQLIKRLETKAGWGMRGVIEAVDLTLLEVAADFIDRDDIIKQKNLL